MRREAGDRCARCLARPARCFCVEIPRVENRTEVVIVRHYSEAGRPSNTGRLAALALARARLIDHGSKDAVLPDDLAGPDTWLLYPDPAPGRIGPPPGRLIVLDASWSQARHMRQRLAALRGLPILALPARAQLAAQPTLRTPPAPGHLPTLLAIAEALGHLEGDAVAAALRALFAVAVDRLTTPGRVPPRMLQP